MISPEDAPLVAAYPRVLEASTDELAGRGGGGEPLRVTVTEKEEFRIAPRGCVAGLIFADFRGFLMAMSIGFAWPRLGPLLFRPLAGLRAIRALRAVAEALRGAMGLETRVAVGIRAGLAAAEAYARLHPKCVEAIGREVPGCVAFAVTGADVMGWFRVGPDGFSSGGDEAPEEPASRVTFRDLEVANRAVEMGLDPLIAPATGEVAVSGRIPLAEAVGYVADMAIRNLVIPR